MHTVDAKEIENFAKDSSRWWDEDGPFRPLHRLNPVRLQYIKDRICEAHDLDVTSLKPYRGLSILDIGCGGGLVCEPMARLGANVTGIDADANAISISAAHAKQSGLTVDYKAVSSEELLKSKARFDVVLALEIVEHVSDVDAFVQNCADLCKPGGIVIFSTLNRTAKSFVLGKLAAEYVLGWVPKGTHDWKKFLKPSELARAGRSAGLHSYDTEGMVFDAAAGNFKRSPRDIDVNYFMAFSKQA